MTGGIISHARSHAPQEKAPMLKVILPFVVVLILVTRHEADVEVEVSRLVVLLVMMRLRRVFAG